MIPLLLACAEPAPDSVAEEVGPTWYADVRPVIDQHCARCHADVGVATSFDDPEVAASLAELMLARIDAGEMPPPAPDPDCRDYAGADRYVLPDEGRETIRAWVEAGAPVGDPADAPEVAAPTTIAPFDLELRGSAPYTPTFPDGVNDYQCFRLDLENDAPVFLTGLEALVDQPQMVHHIVLFDAPASAGESLVDDPTAGFPCGGFGEDGWDFVAGWAPGAEPLRMPEGMGIKLQRDTHLVLQMHYYNAGPEVVGLADQSGYGLLLADDVDKQIYVYPLGTYDFTIRAGDADATSQLVIPWDATWPEIEIWGVFPHMHQLGSGFEMLVARPDQSQDCLVEMDAWDFHNQVAVQYDAPVAVAGGDVISLTCHWDNSAENPAQPSDPPVDVSFGEGTDEEMCFGFTYGAMAD